MKRIISLFLVVSLCLCLLSACGAKKQLLGNWECNVNMTEQVRQLLADEGLGGDLPIGDFSVTLQLTFTEDDRFTLTVDQQKLTESFDALSKSLGQALLDNLQQKLTETGLNVDLGALLGLSSFSPEDLTEKLEQNIEEAQLPQKLYEPISLEGFYKVSGDKLLLTDDPEAKLDEVYFPYKLENNTLTLSAQVGLSTFLGNHPVFGTEPVTFTRAK